MKLLPALYKAPACVMLSASLLLSTSGCKSKAAAPDDSGLTTQVQAQIGGDSALVGQTVKATVAGGVATINGTVMNDAQKAIAGRDAAGVTGIREVMNNLTVQPAGSVTAVAAPPPPIAMPIAPTPVKSVAVKPAPPLPRAVKPSADRQAAPIERHEQQQQSYNPPPPIEQPVRPVAPPPAQPAFRNVSIPAGSTIPVRVSQTLDSATTQEGSTFSGVVASDIMVDGVVAIPAGATVSGHVDSVHEAGHFKGASLLTVSLSSVSRRGDHIPVTTDPYTVEGKGRGKNTAEKAGIGAVGGAILGGIFGGGKGAAIGAAAGGGAGAGINGVTRGQQVQIESETVVRFHLTSAVPVRVRTDRDDRPDRNDRQDGGLQPR